MLILDRTSKISLLKHCFAIYIVHDTWSGSHVFMNSYSLEADESTRLLFGLKIVIWVSSE